MTNSIIKPTVGRVVWFHPDELTAEAGFARHQDGQPYAAIIARVWSDRLVNLTVFDANGAPHPRTSVELVQDGGTVPGNGFYCEWMPYQKGQAAQTASAEKELVQEPAGFHPTQRQQLEYALVSGAAATLAQSTGSASDIATGIQVVLDRLYPQPLLTNPHTGAPRDPRDVASDPQAILCAALGEPLKAAFITIPSAAFGADPEKFGVVAIDALPVVDPGPDSLEREIQAKADKAPRVTPADVKAEVVGETYTVLPSGRVTVCELTLKNGFTVRGESAVVHIENFDEGIGRKVARENAEKEVWQLLGFRLRDKLACA